MTKNEEITKLERKLKQIRDGKWIESPEHVHKLEARLDSLKKEQSKDGVKNGRY